MIDLEQMTWYHRRARGFQEWVYGLGEGPFNSKLWAICILQHNGKSRYEITYYRALYQDGVFDGFLGSNWDERVDNWSLGVEELKTYALWEWRTHEE